MKRTRLWVWLAFLSSVLAAVPVWWHTTSTHKSPLPCADVEYLANFTQTLQKWTIRIDLVALSQHDKALSQDDANFLSGAREQLAKLLAYHNKDKKRKEEQLRFHYDYQVESRVLSLPSSTWATLFSETTHQGLDNALLHHTSGQGDAANSSHYTVFIIRSHPSIDLDPAFFLPNTCILGAHRHAWIASFGQDTTEDIMTLAESIARAFTHYLTLPIPVSHDDSQISSGALSGKTAVVGGEYRLSFSLLNANPSHSNALYSWSFTDAATLFLKPLLDKLSVVANFSMDSQVLQYVSLPQNPAFDPETQTYYFTPAALTHFLHPNDLNSDFTVTSEAVVNFMLYIPSQDHYPLRIRLDDGVYSSTNGFLILGAGGIVIFNPEFAGENNSSTYLKELSALDLWKPMSVFVSQLRELIGVGPCWFGSSGHPSMATMAADGVAVVASPTGIAQWEIDALLRARTATHLGRAIASMRALCGLATRQTHMVVHDGVSQTLHLALAQLSAVQRLLMQAAQQQHGLAYEEAHARVLEAAGHAERAFFDPEGMVSLLYFPPEHEAAIYIPHFLPVFYPIVVGLLFELKNFLLPRLLLGLLLLRPRTPRAGPSPSHQ